MDVNSQFWPEADSGGIRILGDRNIGCDGGLNQMNFEGGFSNPPERLNPMRGNWMPITPDKQIQRSNQGNQFPAEEWQQLTGMYGAIIQEPTTNFNGGPQNFNPMGAVQNAGCYGDLAERSSRVHSNIAGSYAQAINMDRPSWDGSFSLANLMAMRNAALRTQTNRTYRGIPIGNAPRIPDLHSQVDTRWRRPYAGTTPLATVNQWSTSNQMGACNMSQIPQHGFPVPYRSNNYNLNLPPRAETDATTISNSVGISTLPQNEIDKFGGSQFSAMFNLLTDESSSKKNDQENFVPLVGNEEVRHPCNELQNIVDSSSTVISTPFKENTDSEKASDQYIDLNKTPQLKAPKRRKIRPKVVIEGKPKRVPKSAGQSSKENQTAKRKYVRKTGLKESGFQQAVTINSPTRANPENTDSKENTTGKRKYVRRKGVTESATQQADIRHSNTDPNAGRATKSCRRGLNFDLEKSSDDDQGKKSGQEKVRESTRPSNLNLDSRETELGAGTSSLCETRSDGQISQQGRTTGTSNFTPSMANMLNNYISRLGRQAEGAPQASMIGRHIENSNISSIGGNADQWLRKSQLGYTPRQQNIYTEGIGQIVYQTKKSEENTETTRQPMSQNRPYQVLNTFSNFIGARGSKREFQQMLEQGECYRNSSNFGTGLSETHKRKRFENGLLTRVYGMPLVRAVDDASREDSTKTINGVGINCFKSQINQKILTSYFDNRKSPRKLSSGVNNFNGSMDPHCKAAVPNLPQQQAPELHSYTDRMGETRRVTMVQNLASLTTCESHNLHPPATPRKASAKGKGQVKRTFHTTEQADLQAQDTLNKQLSIQSKGLTGWKQNPIQIGEIINRLKDLKLKESDHTLLGQEQKALVLYKGNGAIVLQDIKKSKPRPKVDLDPETNRIWKILMGNEGSEGIEGTDKEKWWEGEREVFRGRANSFIARMHLVQGDRRFSPWKGSVVDSVIGVFLTQNVSDHLSSSAFMCLAARFPLNSTSKESYVSNGKSILVEEPEDCIVNLENVSCLPVYNPSSITPQELRDQRRDSEASGTERTSFTEAQSQSIEEEIISSQGSYDSSIVQDNEGIRSSSGSNSEADDPINGSIYKMSHGSSSTNFQEMEKTTMFQECCSRVNGSSIFDERSNYQNKQLERMECGMPRSRLKRDNLKSSAFTYPITSQDQMRVPAAPSKNCVSHMNPEFRAQEYIGIFCEESGSPLSSTSSEFIKAKDANCKNNLMAENVSENNIQHSRLLRSQEILTMGPFELSSRHSVQHDSISLTEPHTGHAKTLQHNDPSGRNNSFQTENISVAEALKHAEGLANWKNDSMHNNSNVSKQMENASDIEERISVMTKQSNAENKSVKPKPKPKEQVHFSSKADNEMNTKAKKVKAENEGKKTFDWDSLRRQVQANGRKERSKDAMDTMDYEEMRCAKVKEISDAIKERGMNNMLAERIQDFLNRLVREHGGIDLEWLRDVPPDKAKEYLLSIRGLGLKSVECVRLLTLQQLAFPVDTNVGRIAVRLGWVPLQPLPESLQLHLLEMYPILESVQKYIWPRLCKLDQRTLYELHYQMITFGKVFCTKNKPNCNACPMKGECRHFASAFASARLALPSPEEKSIVTSTFPTAQAENPTAVINPMLLLKEAGPGIGKCDPIIEEPATPEQERAEISETDIEDMFDEDPNEIPTIKLNIETFTENLQKYMKDNMELQEGDMSKALVALNPEAAAIPTPKLKNVSRLRTEHQVYELPDSHPLLKGMERREPDDPSPYLLAIWTPGETADSVQTPEIRCSFQDTGKLCNDDTCFSCNSMRESNSQTVRGTILVPCRTAMRGSFPLNGTYFQVNEMFADHDSSVNPIDVPRAWIWNLPRRTVYFGTSVSTIFKGLSTEGIQYCFWRGFVCVRGFDHKTRAPRPLSRRLHAPASKLVKQ